jgi:hypothetical protein
VLGKVTEVTPAGSIHIPLTATPGHGQKGPPQSGVIPGTIKVVVEFTTMFAPGTAIKDFLVLQQPETTEAVAVTGTNS